MVSSLFAHGSSIIFDVFKEDAPALWKREGQPEADPIACHFKEEWREAVVDGFSTSAWTPTAKFQVSDIALIDPSRTKDLSMAMKNLGRDKLIINGKRYEIESCRGDSYGWIEVQLIGPFEE